MVARALWPVIRPIYRTQFAHFGRSAIIPPTRVLGARFISIGDGVSIDHYCEIHADPADPDVKHPILTIGDGCQINGFNRIGATHHVEIQEDVLMASHIFICDTTHTIDDPELPILKQGAVYLGPVVIERGCWLGDGVKILGGVTIGRNSVIGANSVVTKSIPSYSVAAGNPARVLRRIKEES
jgi:acetyltransferase-like isoleucine patch superfamily enzyme